MGSAHIESTEQEALGVDLSSVRVSDRLAGDVGKAGLLVCVRGGSHWPVCFLVETNKKWPCRSCYTTTVQKLLLPSVHFHWC